MSLSKREVNFTALPIEFEMDHLAISLKEGCSEVEFAILMGSAIAGRIERGSDLDIAVYLSEKKTSHDFFKITRVIETAVPEAVVDLGFLNGNEPVYRYESLKGRLLFTRNDETWLRFYSLTCREYEHWMWHYEKQRRYRIELSEAAV